MKYFTLITLLLPSILFAQNLQLGVPPDADFFSWQSGDAETSAGGGGWHCNAHLAANANGTITNWEIYVDNGGIGGKPAQLSVIRCSSGSGGSGPALSGCVMVGLSPPETISVNGLNSFTLAGSTQLDGAIADSNGIAVQAGDYICADSNAFDIGVDCNGTSVSGGCPGPDFDTQFISGLDLASEPFDLLNSTSDGIIMIRAWGSFVPPIFKDGFEGEALPGCLLNSECGASEFCATASEGFCGKRGECTLRPTSCPDIFLPVCGCDGQTYLNACDSAQAGVNIDYPGNCN